MAGSDETPTTTEWRRTSKFYRRPLGLVWLIGLVLIPLLLGTIGYGARDRNQSEANEPSGTMPTLSESPLPSIPLTGRAPGFSLAPLSIVRNGNGITLDGDMPSFAAKDALTNAVIGSVGSDVNVMDNIGINAGVKALDFSAASPVFKAAATIPDFNLSVSGDTITLAGTAASESDQDAVEEAADQAWPNLNIVDTIEAAGPVAPPGASTPSPAPAPAPGPGALEGVCANLQSDITGLLKTPISFVSNGITLTAASKQPLTQVAGKLKACPGAHATVNGYTDNSGNDAINVPLSSNRADAVAGFLVAQGVTGDHVVAKGFGSADPIADNATPTGRAQNRRVVIVVS